METVFSGVVSKKVTYIKPLFLLDMDLRDKEIIGGSRDTINNKPTGLFEYRSFIKNDDVRLRLNYGFRRISENGILILRKIFLDRNMWYNTIAQYIDFDEITDKTLDNDALNILGEAPIMSKFELNTEKKIIIRTNDTETNPHAKEFLESLADLIYNATHNKHKFLSLSEINEDAKKNKFKFAKQYTPRTTPENNPLFVSYLLYEKNIK